MTREVLSVPMQIGMNASPEVCLASLVPMICAELHFESVVTTSMKTQQLVEAWPPSLRRHNQTALAAITDYLVCFAESYKEELSSDTLLPFSNLSVEPQGVAQSCPEALAKHSLNVKIRSLFVAASGHGDTFSSLEELYGTVRHGIYVNKSMVPTFDLPEDGSLNAYLLDFYKHGDFRFLVEHNRIKRENLWDLVRDFDVMQVSFCVAIHISFLPHSGTHARILLEPAHAVLQGCSRG